MAQQWMWRCEVLVWAGGPRAATTPCLENVWKNCSLDPHTSVLRCSVLRMSSKRRKTLPWKVKNRWRREWRRRRMTPKPPHHLGHIVNLTRLVTEHLMPPDQVTLPRDRWPFLHTHTLIKPSVTRTDKVFIKWSLLFGVKFKITLPHKHIYIFFWIFFNAVIRWMSWPDDSLRVRSTEATVSVAWTEVHPLWVTLILPLWKWRAARVWKYAIGTNTSRGYIMSWKLCWLQTRGR